MFQFFRNGLALSALTILVTACSFSEAPLASADGSDDFAMTGWATAGTGTTGGAGGETIVVMTPEDLVREIRREVPLVVQVKGTIDLGDPFPGYKGDGQYHVESNKTIIGIGPDAGILRGEFRLTGVSNIIIRNLGFHSAPDTALAITHGTTQVWIDHNDFSDAGDGLIDITRASDYITVSWNRFSNHTKVSLVGAGDAHFDDRGHNRVTFHHNWFVNTNERHPRVRFGKVHLFNNLYDNVNSGIGIGVEAMIVSESNVFVQPGRPYVYQDTEDQPGYMKDSQSIFDREDLPALKADGITWSPADHYDYTLDEASDVPDRVRESAGVGIISGSD